MKNVSDKKEHKQVTSRREFLAGSVAAVPLVALLGCGDEPTEIGVADSELSQAAPRADRGTQHAQRRERRRQRTLQEHLGAENALDIDAFVATFARGAELVFNGIATSRKAEIRSSTNELFMALEGYSVIVAQQQNTPRGILVEGALSGRHVRELAGFPATGRMLVIPYSAFYGFSRHDDAIQMKRVVANYGMLGWFALG
jgi:hypothetical protein